MVRGSWRVVRFCLGGAGSPGLVEIPRATARATERRDSGASSPARRPTRSRSTSTSERDVLIVHLVDASDPEAVRARHARTHERWRAGWRPEMPELVLTIGAGWATLLLVAGGLLLLRARDTLHRVLALDVLVTIVVALLTLLSYLRDVSYYIDAALALALLSFTATLVAARHVRGRGPFS